MHSTLVLATTETGCVPVPLPIMACAPMTLPGPTLARRERRETPRSSSHVKMRSTVPLSTIPVYVALARRAGQPNQRSEEAQGMLELEGATR